MIYWRWFCLGALIAIGSVLSLGDAESLLVNHAIIVIVMSAAVGSGFLNLIENCPRPIHHVFSFGFGLFLSLSLVAMVGAGF